MKTKVLQAIDFSGTGVGPVAYGGADAPLNMQWQTVAEAKAKDKVERFGC